MTHLENAIKHHQQGRLEEAESAYRSALADNPDNGDLLHYMGVLLCQTGNFEEGISCLEKAAALLPDNASVPYHLAKGYQARGDYENAVAAYSAALQINPEYSNALNNLGNLHHAANEIEKALLCFERAVKAEPGHANAAFNLGVVYRDLGYLEQSEKILKALNESNPDQLDTLFALGNILRDQNKLKEALSIFERILSLQPDHASTRYLVELLKGNNPETPPADYILSVFDPYASRFDNQLVGRLKYDAPQKLADLLQELEMVSFSSALDMGCGTGISGQAFRPLARRLSGIDLSPNMVDEARKKKLYDNLAVDELIRFLSAVPEKFDLFIATDVFIYLGNLDPLFTGVVAKSKSGAVFAFSTECTEGPDFEALPTGRYAHSMFYIQRLADNHGFKVLACRETPIREERGEGVPGHLFILQKSPEE